jgi:hypothetical protein
VAQKTMMMEKKNDKKLVIKNELHDLVRQTNTIIFPKSDYMKKITALMIHLTTAK